MDNPALTGFVLAFVAGPLLGAVLLRRQVDARGATRLALAVFLCLGAAVLFRHSALGALFSLWLGWILAVVTVAQVLRRRLADAEPRRWMTRGAVMACALPWFGLATAQMMD